MKLVVLDFETYYDSEYSLSKLTTEAYIRDARFEPILMSYFEVEPGRELSAASLKDIDPRWVAGRDNIQSVLDSLDIENSACLAHHAHFDGLILSHHFGIRPKVWFDTLSMARAVLGIEVGGSLGKLLTHYSNRVSVAKGDYVVQAKGKHLKDFSGKELIDYGIYCCNDTEGCFQIFNCMMDDGFPKAELRQIDMLIRMFTEPHLELDADYLREYMRDLQAQKNTALITAGVQKDEVMSNPKFAEALKRLGVSPPMKVSPTTGMLTFAFAKTDPGLQSLEDHPDFRVQALVAARLESKSTINETRAERMIDMAGRGPACIYYNYAGAKQTMRVSGGDKMNWQNLERIAWNEDETELLRGQLRMSIYAPHGYLAVVMDSSNIEARILDCLANQENMIEAYRRYDRGEGPDIYCVVASGLYNKPVDKSMKMERMLGKVVKLACGYGMGAERFQETARIWSGGALDLQMGAAVAGVNGYRSTHPMIEQFWNRAQSALPEISSGPEDQTHTIDMHGLLRVERNAIVLPNGLKLKYPQLSYEKDGGWSFLGGHGGQRTYIYGGKLVENIVQALAKIVVMDQILAIKDEWSKRWSVGSVARMTTHDEGVFVVPEPRAEEMLQLANEKFRESPKWMPFLPVAGTGAIAVRYGEAK